MSTPPFESCDWRNSKDFRHVSYAQCCCSTLVSNTETVLNRANNRDMHSYYAKRSSSLYIYIQKTAIYRINCCPPLNYLVFELLSSAPFIYLRFPSGRTSIRRSQFVRVMLIRLCNCTTNKMIDLDRAHEYWIRPR